MRPSLRHSPFFHRLFRNAPRLAPMAVGLVLIVVPLGRILSDSSLLTPHQDDLATRARIVTQRPADAYAWARLAYAQLKAGDNTAAWSLALSYRTGPHERELALDRLPLAAQLWPVLDTNSRQSVLEETERAWDLFRPELLRRLPPYEAWPLYRRVLAERPEAIEAMEKRARTPF